MAEDVVIPTPTHGQLWRLKNKTYKHSDLVRVEQQLELSRGIYVLYWYVGVPNQPVPQIQHIETFLYGKEFVDGNGLGHHTRLPRLPD